MGAVESDHPSTGLLKRGVRRAQEIEQSSNLAGQLINDILRLQVKE